MTKEVGGARDLKGRWCIIMNEVPKILGEPCEVTYEVTKGGARDSGPKDMHVTHNDVPNDWGGEGEDM